MTNKISAHKFAEEILEKVEKDLKLLSNITNKIDLNEKVEIGDTLEQIEKDLKIAIILGSKKACFFIAQHYDWCYRNLILDQEIKEKIHADIYYKEMIYIGSKLGDNKCLKIREDLKISKNFSLEISEEELNKKVEGIKKIQDYYSSKTFENSEEEKEKIYSTHFRESSDDTDDGGIAMIGSFFFPFEGKDSDSLIETTGKTSNDDPDICVLL